ncbi:MAG: hypothetical protein IJW54_06585 [Clostridia bacterium]|nr:hypothetical protein [Clostridia bacterium]
MKQEFKAPLKQVIWARIYIIGSLISSVLLSFSACLFFFVFNKSDVLVSIIAIVFCVLLVASAVFVATSFWKSAFSKIVIENGVISAVCLFAKRVSISVSEVRKLAVRKEGNTKFVLITSDRNLPYKETEKIQTENGLIKFYLTEELSLGLTSLLPTQLTKPLRKI